MKIRMNVWFLFVLGTMNYSICASSVLKPKFSTYQAQLDYDLQQMNKSLQEVDDIEDTDDMVYQDEPEYIDPIAVNIVLKLVDGTDEEKTLLRSILRDKQVQKALSACVTVWRFYQCEMSHHPGWGISFDLLSQIENLLESLKTPLFFNNIALLARCTIKKNDDNLTYISDGDAFVFVYQVPGILCRAIANIVSQRHVVNNEHVITELANILTLIEACAENIRLHENYKRNTYVEQAYYCTQQILKEGLTRSSGGESYFLTP